MRLPGVKYLQGGPSVPHMDASIAMQPGRAVEQLGGAIEGVAEKGFSFVERYRKMKDAGNSSAFMANLDHEESEFRNSLIQRQDSQNWTSEWKTKVGDMQSRIGGQDLSPEGKYRLQMEFNDWAGRKTDQLATTAMLKGVETTKGQIANSLNYSAARGDREGTARAMGDMRASGLYNEPDIVKVEQDLDSRFLDYDLNEKKYGNPKQLLEQVNDPDFIANNPGATIEMQRKYQLQAKDQIQRYRNDQNDVLEDRYKSGELTWQDLEVAENITDEDRKGWVKALRDNTPPGKIEEAAAWNSTDALRQARQDPSITNEEYRELFNETRAYVRNKVPLNFQGDIGRELGYLTPAGRDPEKGPSVTGAYEESDLTGIARDTVFRARDTGAFGIADPKRPKVSNPAYEKADVFRIEAQKAVKTAYKKNPDMMPQEAIDIANSVMSGERIKQGAKVMPSMMPGGAGSARTGGSSFVPQLPGKGPNLPRRGPIDELPRDELDYTPGVLPPLEDRLNNYTR